MMETLDKYTLYFLWFAVGYVIGAMVIPALRMMGV